MDSDKKSTRKILRNTEVFSVYIIKILVNACLAIGIIFFTPDLVSKLFGAITFLFACFFDVLILYVVNKKLDYKVKIWNIIAIVATIIIVIVILFLLAYKIIKPDTNFKFSNLIINSSIIIVGVYSCTLEIICNMPDDD